MSSTQEIKAEEIKAEEQPLDTVFSEQYTFLIPNYQRPYAWQTDHAEKLLDDLLEAAGEDGEDLSTVAPYFLGSIVLIRKERDGKVKVVEVVDGQQRLTTLSLLFAVLRAHLPKYSASLEKRLRQPEDALLGQEGVPRLMLRDRDQDFYKERILTPDGLDGQLDESTLSDSQRNLWRNARCLYARLGELSDARKQRLAKYALTRCYLVTVETTNFGSAYRIFSVLNDRGMELQATDILKSKIIGDVPEAERDAYTKKWEDAEEALGRERFLDLISHIRMIRLKTKLRKSVLDEIQEHVLSVYEPRAFIDNMVVPLADAMTVLLGATHESAEHAEEINSTIRCLHLIDNSDWVPPALAYYGRHRSDAAALLLFLRDLERLAASMMIRRVNINGRIYRYGKLLTAIEGQEDLYADRSPLQLSREERDETRSALEGDIYLVPRIRRPVLLRLDQFLGDAMATYRHDYVTVEHVLPQNPPPDSTWLSDFPDEEERRSLVHKLGNLVLLSRRKNSSANNRPFEDKKKSYFANKKGGVSTFALTTNVIKEAKWTPEVIRRRQGELLGLLRKGWRL